MKTSYSFSGFTIIEIIVAISVITILVSVSYAGYAAFSQRQKLTSAGQTLKNDLRDIQSRSFNSEADCSICNCNNPSVSSSVAWYIDLSESERKFYGICQGNLFTVTNLNLESDILIETNINDNLIQFISDPPRVNTDTRICLSLDGLSGKYYRIDVSRSGDISDSGGLDPTCTL